MLCSMLRVHVLLCWIAFGCHQRNRQVNVCPERRISEMTVANPDRPNRTAINEARKTSLNNLSSEHGSLYDRVRPFSVLRQFTITNGTT